MAKSHVAYLATWASPGVAEKGRGVRVGPGSAAGALPGLFGWPVGRFPPRPISREGFFENRTALVLFLKFGVFISHHKQHVTFGLRDFLWLKSFGLKFCFDVGHSALAPVFWASSPQITPEVAAALVLSI